jgi:hypothetical protein
MRSLSRLNLLNLAAFLTIAGSAVSGVLQIDRILQRWLVLILLLFLGFLQSRLPVEVESPQQLPLTNLLIALQALIVAYLVWSTGLGFSFWFCFHPDRKSAALYNSLRGTLLWMRFYRLDSCSFNPAAGRACCATSRSMRVGFCSSVSSPMP